VGRPDYSKLRNRLAYPGERPSCLICQPLASFPSGLLLQPLTKLSCDRGSAFPHSHRLSASGRQHTLTKRGGPARFLSFFWSCQWLEKELTFGNDGRMKAHLCPRLSSKLRKVNELYRCCRPLDSYFLLVPSLLCLIVSLSFTWEGSFCGDAGTLRNGNRVWQRD
jgi:hypothetical protein